MTVRFLVTAGPTREYLDPVRFISNPSSGRMGYAVAEAALRAGGRVTLVSGPVALVPPAGVRLIEVETAEEMRRAVRDEAAGADVVVMAAAVADYRPARRSRRKLKKGPSSLSVRMVRTPDILAELGRRRGKALLVGFAAETGDPAREAARKLAQKGLDLVIGNDVSRRGSGFGSGFNEAVFVGRNGECERLPRMRKERLARLIVRRCLALRGSGAGGRTRTGTPA